MEKIMKRMKRMKKPKIMYKSITENTKSDGSFYTIVTYSVFIIQKSAPIKSY